MASRKKPEKRDAMSFFGYRGGGDKPRKKQIINYDKQGNVIGDDGFSMTPTRKRMHRIFDAWFIYLFIMIVVSVVCMVLAYMQGAQYTDWEIVQRGGNQFHGWDTALLLRLEALLALYSAVISALINFFGFRWFYDRKPVVMVYAMMLALGLVCVGYTVYAIVGVGTFEPLSLVNLSFILVTLVTMRAVSAERPSLRKPKVGRREVK
mgnify:CR=1 FL=1